MFSKRVWVSASVPRGGPTNGTVANTFEGAVKILLSVNSVREVKHGAHFWVEIPCVSVAWLLCSISVHMCKGQFMVVKISDLWVFHIHVN